MFSLMWRQLRGRAGRSVALLLGILVATTGFVVLTGATTTSQLQVTGEVKRNTRAAYDILVRPQGARTPLEAEQRLVRPNYLSGGFGGITTAQWEQVRTMAGIEVAAPIAMIGHATSLVPVEFDVTGAVDRSLERQVIRLDPTYLAERGLSTARGKARYVYVTRRPLIYPGDSVGDIDAAKYSDGRTYPYHPKCGPTPREVQPDGSTRPICDPGRGIRYGGMVDSELDAWEVMSARLLPDGRFESESGPDALTTGKITKVTDRLLFGQSMIVPFLLAAVDPDAEQRLVGLDRTIVTGRALTGGDRITETPYLDFVTDRAVPVLLTSRPYLDGGIRAALTRLPGPGPLGVPHDRLARVLSTAPGSPAGTAQVSLADGYRAQIAQPIKFPFGCCQGQLMVVTQAGPVTYTRQPGGVLRAGVVPPAGSEVLGDQEAGSWLSRPWLAGDTGSRQMRRLDVGGPDNPRTWRAVGVFDPEKLSGFSDLGRVPLETYEPPRAGGADERSRTALGGQPLEPSGNPAGYLSAPPLLLTNLASGIELLEGGTGAQRAAPISALRVRVSDVDGYTRQSAERVRLIAEQIAARTGLDVDITLGSSPDPQTVEVPAGSFGRPQLRLTENWSALGVASVIVQAVDRKSAALFALVLLVCALFLGNAVSAAVRDRRSELAVLSCLGWPARRIFALILGEVALLGLLAGVLSIALAVPLGAATGIGLDLRRAALAVPVAVLLALAAGLLPAIRAARTYPAAAVRPVVARARWLRRPRSLLGMAAVNLVRTPGRALLGASALAVGIAALTLVTMVAWTFRGAVVGSLLGDAVSLSVRGADVLAATATVLLGVAAVADVLYLGIRDRAAELAALRATGWTESALSRLVAYEGLLLGGLGALAGAGLGLAAAAWLVGEVPHALLLVAAGTAAGGILLSGLAALVPTALLRRLPIARLLAEE